ncbi:DNA polymerase III subunit delta' [Luteithermobacter gelatinilyticus]|uniref:DNA polymerase III subunit delta' n=1 Tax=Luteithermobacter gelatinilyticus TaxID=2582913 RepID=UPI001105993F|nr:DNA polymerase III subunit delta' [Luteithermobacter gelatinilyticus]
MEELEMVPHARLCREVIGHEAASRLFLDAFNADKLHHAWMITGPRGIGKASLAYHMARFLLHHAPTEEAGGGLFGDTLEKTALTTLATDPESRTNQLINAGSHPDLLSIERGLDEKTGKRRKEIVIDEVRRLQGFFNTTSSDGGWRIAIIDSADEMNRNAANALLKVLEEPPRHALLFILAHAPGRLLPTIRSRCRQMRLKPLTDQAVAEILRRENPELPEEELAGYAVLSEGSPGYALNLVHQKGLELYSQILSLLSTLPEVNVPALHVLAGELAGRNNQDRFRLFGELLLRFMNRMTRHAALSAQEQVSSVHPVMTGELELMASLGQRIPLDQWGELWEKVSQLITRTDAVNLDRKLVVINIFSMISQTVKG